MRYTGNKCDGCQNIFVEADDIVVCPECATPQHRHCYEENGKCVNEHLHSQDFQWQGESVKPQQIESSTLVGDEPQGEALICPNCGYANKPGATVCEQCGMKFVMFGVNVVENLQKSEAQEKQASTDTAQEIPDYTPPFVIGEGEGFEYPSEDASAEPTDTDPQSVKYFNENDDEHIFKGPYPDSDTTLGIRTNTIGAFIRVNADNYIRKFKNAEYSGSGVGFNWAAFFFGPYWFFYRKQIKTGIILLTIQFCLSLIILPTTESMMAFIEGASALDPYASEAALAEFMSEFQQVMLPIAGVGVVEFIINLFFAFRANTIYKNYVLQNIQRASTLGKRSEKIALFTKYGGTSFMFVALAYLAEMLLSNIVSMIIY